MFDDLRAALDALEVVVRDFEPRCLDGPGAVRAVELFARVKHLGVAGVALAARRVEETHAHEITGAARKDPRAEAELVRAATAGTSMKGLKDRCRRVRAAAEADDAAWAQRLHDTRSLRQWVDADSAPCGQWRMSPDKGAEVKAALDAETDLIFREARAAGTRQPRDAYAADALHALVTRGPRKATSAHLVCAGAKVRAVPADGGLLPEYSSNTRYLPQWLKDWLDQRYPVCGQPGCDADFHLEYDHVVPLEAGGRTEKRNLWRLCWHHHDLKTTKGWRIEGPPRQWHLVPPDDPDPPDDPVPPDDPDRP